MLALLERATGRGLIDLNEYTQRSAAVVAARTRGELNAVLVDLPGLQVGGHDLAGARAATTTAPLDRAGRLPGYSGAPAARFGADGGVLELTGFGARTMRGHWTVPRTIVIGGFGAATRLDFTEAVLTSAAVTVDFRGSLGGAVDLVVPAGTRVQMDRLSMRGGSLANRIAPGGAGPLELDLIGTRRGGSLVIRVPRRGLFPRR